MQTTGGLALRGTPTPANARSERYPTGSRHRNAFIFHNSTAQSGEHHSRPTPPEMGGGLSDPAMGYGCVCTTGTVRHKAEVQSKSQREKLFSDMS